MPAPIVMNHHMNFFIVHLPVQIPNYKRETLFCINFPMFRKKDDRLNSEQRDREVFFVRTDWEWGGHKYLTENVPAKILNINHDILLI